MMHEALRRAGHLHAMPGYAAAPAAAPAAAAPVASPAGAPMMTGSSAQPTPAAVTPLPRPAAARPAAWPELVALYYNIDALRTSDAPVVLQFVASRPGEGTSTIARAFATFAAGEETSPVLLIDGAGRRPTHDHGLPMIGATAPSLAETVRGGLPFEQATSPDRSLPHLHEARLADEANSLLHTDAAAWLRLTDEARRRYRFTLIDSPAISTHPDSVVLGRGCDGVVLVVEAEATRAPVARASIEAIERFGGKVLGVALNKRRFHIPRWAYRRL